MENLFNKILEEGFRQSMENKRQQAELAQRLQIHRDTSSLAEREFGSRQAQQALVAKQYQDAQALNAQHYQDAQRQQGLTNLKEGITMPGVGQEFQMPGMEAIPSSGATMEPGSGPLQGLTPPVPGSMPSPGIDASIFKSMSGPKPPGTFVAGGISQAPPTPGYTPPGQARITPEMMEGTGLEKFFEGGKNVPMSDVDKFAGIAASTASKAQQMNALQQEAEKANAFVDANVKDSAQAEALKASLRTALVNAGAKNGSTSEAFQALDKIRQAVMAHKSGGTQNVDNWIVQLRDPDPKVREAARANIDEHNKNQMLLRPVNNFSIAALEKPSTLTGQAFLDSVRATDPGTANKLHQMSIGAIAGPRSDSRSTAAQQTLRALLQYDPTWTEQRAQMRKAITTGPDSRNILNLNTAPEHLAQLSDAADALANGNFTPGNATWNALKSAMGAAAPNNFNEVKAAVASEMASALKGNATDKEIEKQELALKSAGSPDQLRGVIREAMLLVGTKLKKWNEKYHQNNPGDPEWSPVYPGTQKVFDKYQIPWMADVVPAGVLSDKEENNFLRKMFEDVKKNKEKK